MDLKSLIKTKEEKQASQQAYFERMFPFGEVHKENIETMCKIVAGKSKADSMLFFYYLVAKDKYLLNPDDITLKASVKAFKKVRPRLAEENLRDLCALVILDVQSESLDQLPSRDEITQFAQTLRLD